MRDTSGLIKCVEVSLLMFSQLQQQEVSTIYIRYGASRTKHAEGLNVYVLMRKGSGMYALTALTVYQPVTVFVVMVSHKHMHKNLCGELI